MHHFAVPVAARSDARRATAHPSNRRRKKRAPKPAAAAEPAAGLSAAELSAELSAAELSVELSAAGLSLELSAVEPLELLSAAELPAGGGGGSLASHPSRQSEAQPTSVSGLPASAAYHPCSPTCPASPGPLQSPAKAPPKKPKKMPPWGGSRTPNRLTEEQDARRAGDPGAYRPVKQAKAIAPAVNFGRETRFEDTQLSRAPEVGMDKAEVGFRSLKVRTC